MLLTERVNEAFQITESNKDNLPSGVLCRVKYPICNINQLNANRRRYSRDLWERVRSNPIISEQMKNRALFGHAEHPSASQSDLQLTSHVIFEMIIDDNDNKVYQMFDVLDTPTGRIVDCLLRAGCKVGVSTRAEGELQESVDENGGKCYDVVPDKYKYITTDFTADPSTFGALPMDIKRNVVESVNMVLSNERTKDSERMYATGILETISKNDEELKKDCGLVSEKTVSVTASPNSGSVLVTGDVAVVDVSSTPSSAGVDSTVTVNITATEPVSSPSVEPSNLPVESPEPSEPPLDKDLEKSDDFEEDDDLTIENESKFLNESEEIKKLYKNAGLPAPKGKGEHTKAFHKRAIAVAKSYIKSGDSPEEALKKAYPTAMKQLGKKKSLKKNKSKSNESIDNKKFMSSFIKMLNELKVKEAIARVERDKLIEEINKNPSDSLCIRMIWNRTQKIIESLNFENNALRLKLEEKSLVISNMDSKINESVKKLQECNKQIEQIKLDNDKKLKESYELIKKTKEDSEKMIKEKVLEATRSVVKEYANEQIKLFGFVHDNVRALLEDCMSISEVNEVLSEYRESRRRGALHQQPKKMDESIRTKLDEPRLDGPVSRVGKVFEGFGLLQ